MTQRKDIDNNRKYDWGLASDDYAKYRDIYPEKFYAALTKLNICVKGQRVLDIGTGTGVLPRNMARYGANFVGVDVSAEQIAAAVRLTEQAGLNIDYRVNSAENFVFPDKSFDVVTACQCFMYFDKTIALPRIHSVLKDGGHFAILFMAWLPFESEIAMHSEDLVLKYNPDWTGGRMVRNDVSHPDWLNGLFKVANAVGFDVDVPFTRESWNGRMKACRGIGASLSAPEIASWENEHVQYLKTQPEQFCIPHYVTILDLQKL